MKSSTDPAVADSFLNPSIRGSARRGIRTITNLLSDKYDARTRPMSDKLAPPAVLSIDGFELLLAYFKDSLP